MKCPICKEIVVNNKCSNCGFDKFLGDYTNADEVVSWFDEVVIPYRNSISKKMDKKLQNQIKINIKTSIPDFEYIKTEKGICITKYNGFNQKNVCVPSIIEDLPVIELGEKLFDGCSSIEEIILPDTVEKLGEYVFSYTNITSLKLPSKLKIIPTAMCFHCSKLTDINLQHVQKIGASAFYECKNLELFNLSFNNYLNEIGGGAFSSIKGIKNLIIPPYLEVFKYASFEGTAIENLIILNDNINFDKGHHFYINIKNIYCNPSSSAQQHFRNHPCKSIHPITEFEFN